MRLKCEIWFEMCSSLVCMNIRVIHEGERIFKCSWKGVFQLLGLTLHTLSREQYLVQTYRFQCNVLLGLNWSNFVQSTWPPSSLQFPWSYAESFASSLLPMLHPLPGGLAQLSATMLYVADLCRPSSSTQCIAVSAGCHSGSLNRWPPKRMHPLVIISLRVGTDAPSGMSCIWSFQAMQNIC